MRFKKSILVVSTLLATAFYNYVSNPDRVQVLEGLYNGIRTQLTERKVQHAQDAMAHFNYPLAHKYLRRLSIEDKDDAWIGGLKNLLKDGELDTNKLKETSNFVGNISNRPKKYTSIELIADKAFPSDPNGSLCGRILGQINDNNPQTSDDERYRFDALERFAGKFARKGKYDAALFMTSSIFALNPNAHYGAEKRQSSLVSNVETALTNGHLSSAFDLLRRMNRSKEKDTQIVLVFDGLVHAGKIDTATQLLGATYSTTLQYILTDKLALFVLPEDQDGSLLVKILGQINDNDPTTDDDDKFRFSALQRCGVEFAQRRIYNAALKMGSSIDDGKPETTYDKELRQSTLIAEAQAAINNKDFSDAYIILTKAYRSKEKDTQIVPVFDALLIAKDYDKATKLLGATKSKTLLFTLTEKLAYLALPDDEDGSLLVKILGQIDDGNPTTIDDETLKFTALKRCGIEFAQRRNYEAALKMGSSIDDGKPETTFDKELRQSTLIAEVQAALNNQDLPDAYIILTKAYRSKEKDTQIVPVFDALLIAKDYGNATKLLGATSEEALADKLTYKLADNAFSYDNEGYQLVKIFGQFKNDRERFNGLQKYALRYAQQRNYKAAEVLTFSIDDGKPETSDDKIMVASTLESVIDVAFGNYDLQDVGQLITTMKASPKKEALTVQLGERFIAIGDYNNGVKVSSWLTHPDDQDRLVEKVARQQLSHDLEGAFTTASFLPPYKSDSIISDISISYLLSGRPLKSLEKASALDNPFLRYEITRGVFQWYADIHDFDNATLAASTIEDKDIKRSLIDTIKPRWIGSFFASLGYSNQRFEAPYRGTPFQAKHFIGYNLNDKSENRGALLLNFGLTGIKDRKDLPENNVFDTSLGLQYLRKPFSASADIVNRYPFDGDPDNFIRLTANYFSTLYGEQKGSEDSPNQLWLENFLGARWDNADLGIPEEEKNLVVEGKLTAYWDFLRVGPKPKRKNAIKDIFNIKGATVSGLAGVEGCLDTKGAAYNDNIKGYAGIMLHDGPLRLIIRGGYEQPWQNDSPFRGSFFEITFSFGGGYQLGRHQSRP
jgi:hypothetical protein